MSGSDAGRVSGSTVDLAVIGGGLGGMIAAVVAAEACRSVVVLERKPEDRYVNATRLSGGVFHCCLRDPRTAPEQLAEAIAAATAGVSEPQRVDVIAQHALRAIRWLQAHGVRFVKASPNAHQSFVVAPPNVSRRGLAWQGHGGDVVLRTLEQHLLAHGGTLRRGRQVEDLLMDGGRCIGVAGTADGVPFELRAHHVLIADGGFQSDAELLREGITPAPDRVFQRNGRSGFGYGLRMARRVGAKISTLQGFYGHLQTRDAFTEPSLWPYPWWDDVAVQGIVVAGEGRRFCDEGRGGIFIANRLAGLADPLSGVVVFDTAIWNAAGRAGQNPANPNLVTGGATIHHADTLSEVARLAGLDPAILESEVAAYNAQFASGRPPTAKSGAKRLPIATPPFFAAPICAGITYTMGGIVNDGVGRVLDQQDQPIPGLYAAGATTGGLEGGENVGYVGGLIKSAVMSLRVGEHVAATLR